MEYNTQDKQQQAYKAIAVGHPPRDTPQETKKKQNKWEYQCPPPHSQAGSSGGSWRNGQTPSSRPHHPRRPPLRRQSPARVLAPP